MKKYLYYHVWEYKDQTFLTTINNYVKKTWHIPLPQRPSACWLHVRCGWILPAEPRSPCGAYSRSQSLSTWKTHKQSTWSTPVYVSPFHILITCVIASGCQFWGQWATVAPLNVPDWMPTCFAPDIHWLGCWHKDTSSNLNKAFFPWWTGTLLWTPESTKFGIVFPLQDWK